MSGFERQLHSGHKHKIGRRLTYLSFNLMTVASLTLDSINQTKHTRNHMRSGKKGERMNL